MLLGFLQARRMWNVRAVSASPTGTSSMEVDALHAGGTDYKKPIQCWSCGGWGHSAQVCQTSRDVCRKCGKAGHWASTCWSTSWATPPTSGASSSTSRWSGNSSPEVSKGKGKEKGKDKGKDKGKGKGKGKDKGKSKDKGKQKGKFGGKVQEIEIETVEEIDPETLEMLMVGAGYLYDLDTVVEDEVPEGECSKRQRRVDMVLDSAAAIHVLPMRILEKRFADVEPSLTVGLKLFGAGGALLKHYGRVIVDVQFTNKHLILGFEVAEVRDPILSVSCLQGAVQDVSFGSQPKMVLRKGTKVIPHVRKGLYMVTGRLVAAWPAGESQVMPVEYGGSRGSADMPVEYDGSRGSAGPGMESGGLLPPGLDLEAASAPPQQQQVQPKAIKLSEAPSDYAQERHRLLHLPHEEWCDVCLEARGREDPHRARDPELRQLQGVDEPPVFEVDYTFVDVLKILAHYSVEKGCGGATVVEAKGPGEFVVVWLMKQLDIIGVTDVILQADPEKALHALLARVRDRRTHSTMIQEAPRRSKQSMGGVSRYHRRLQEQIRAQKLELERRMNTTIDSALPIVPWLVRHAACSLTRFDVNRELGCTGFTRTCGKTYDGKLVAFGEMVLGLTPEGYQGPQRTSK